MTIQELIKRFEIHEKEDGKIGFCISGKDASKYIPEIKARKAEILAELRARTAAEKAESERKAEELRRNVPGLDELRDAIAENERGYERMRREIQEGEGFIHSYKPIDIEALRVKYPAAAAYLKAEKFSRSSHFIKANAGRKAMDIIVAGGDFEKAISDMEAEWQKYCSKHEWD